MATTHQRPGCRALGLQNIFFSFHLRTVKNGLRSAETIGVPITVNGLARAETIELALHYPLKDLVCDSSVDLSGYAKRDVPGEQWRRAVSLLKNSRMPSREQLPQSMRYSTYLAIPITSRSSRSDSVTVPTAFAPCEYSPPKYR